MSEQIYNPELKENEIDHSKVVNQNAEKPTIYGNVPSYQVSELGEYKRDNKVNMADVVYGLDELNYQRADLQTGAELTGKFFANLASEAVIETAKVPGYLFELGEFVANGFEAEDGFNNEYLDKLNSFKKPTQFDIYKTQSAESGSIWEKLSDPTFIASQGQTVGTTLSLMVPGISVAGLTGRAAAGLGKAAQIGLSGAAAGLFSRGIESAMEGNSIYNEYLQDENRLNEIKSEEFEKRKNELLELKSKYDNLNSVVYNPGVEDETYNLNNAIRNGQIIEIESRINRINEEIEESSKNRLNDEASRASTLGFSANMALAPLEMLEYALLLKPFSSIKKGIDAISKTKVAKVIGGAVAQPAMESIEEGTQFTISKEAIGAASGKHDFFNNGFSDRLSNYIEDPEFHESVALGGAMGLLFSGAGPLARNAYNRISKNVSKLKDDKVLKDKDKVADIIKSGKNEIVSRALINSDDTYDYLEREKVRIKQFSDSEIEKAETEEEKSEIKSNYESIISDLNEIKKIDESLKSDEVFIDNPNARKQYALAKYDYKKNLDKKNKAKAKFEEEFNSIDINSDFSNINLKEGASISEVEEITSNLLKENISLTSYENVRREISKIKSENSELKSKAEKTIDESIKHTKNRIESLESQLNEKVNNHNEVLPVVPNMESMVNNMTNFIKANIDETFFIKPILNSYSTAKADLIKKKENEIAKKVNDKARKILEDELSNIIDSTDSTVEELNKKKEDIKAFESKSGLKISKKIKSKLDDKLKEVKIKSDLELIEKKNEYVDKINNSNVEELELIAEELRSDSSIEESTFDELINLILSKQINAQNDKINKENELKNIVTGTDKSGKEVKGEHVKRNNKDFIKSDGKLIPVTNIRKPEIINPVIEKDVVKPEENVFENTNKNSENAPGFYNQPIGEIQESEIENTQFDNNENESLLTTKVKEYTNDNGKILDAYNESGELIITDKNKLELSSQNNYNEGDEVVFVIDKTFLKEINGKWFVAYGDSLSELTENNLPIGIQTVKDFKDKKQLIGWVKASKQSKGDKQLRNFLYKELVENGIPNFNKTISSIISKKGEGWINKTRIPKLFNKQFKKIKKDGSVQYPNNISIAHANANKEIIGTDEGGNILKSKIQDSPGTVHLVFKNSNGTVNSIRISQKPISKYSESLRKEWTTNVFRIIVDYVLGNREFTDDVNDVRREVSKYFNLNTFADKAMREKIKISNDEEYNNFFGFGIDANSGDMILQLPGNNGFPFMQFKIVKSDDNLFILKYGKNGEYNNISSSELLKEFYERLGNMFPNIVSDRLSNFRRLEFDNKSKKLQWTQPKHYFDFLSEYKIAETKLHALVTESGEAVYTTSPMIIVNNNIEHLSELDNAKVSKLKIENPTDTNELASPKRKVGRPKKQIQKKENLPPLPKGKYALDKDTDSLNNEVSDLSPEDYNNASLKSFNANIDVLNTLVSNVLERLDSQIAETGNTNLEEALNLEKEDLFEMYNIYNFFSKENISKQLADEYGIYTKASDNAAMANNFKQIYDNFEKIVNSKDEIIFIGYRDLITTNIKKLKFSILNEIDEDESDGDKVLETYVENRNFKEDPEKSMSGKIRRLFYKIPVLLKDGKVKGNILGQKVFHDSSNVFNQISDILIDTSPEDMISELENAAYGENGEIINDIAHGVLVKLYELQKSNPETIQMFKSVMKKQQANFITLIYEPPKVKNGYPIAKIIYTNRTSNSNSIVSDWQESFYDTIIEREYIGDDGEIDKKFGEQLYKAIDLLKPGTLKEDVLSILSEIGITFNEKAYLSIVKDFNKKSKYFVKRFGKKAYTKDLISFFKNELLPIANSIKNGNNPFESEARAILNFAVYEAKFSIDSTSRMSKNSNGDNVFTYINPSHASNLLNRLINNLDETTKLIKDPFIGKSTILNSIHNYNKLNSKEKLTESEANELEELSNEISYFKMFYFDASKNKGGWAIAREYETQSVVERELTKISLFLNNGKNSGMIFNPTPSDKTTFSLFQFKKFDTSSFVIKDGKIVSKVDRENEFNAQINKLLSLFVQSEIDRINHVISLFKNAKSNNDFSKLIEGFHYIKKGKEYYPGVGAHFMFMTNLNDFTVNNNMRNQDGSISITNDMSKMIVEEMKFGILELINSKIDSWKNFGLIENGKFKYIDKSVSSKSIDGFVTEYVINNMVGLANEFMMKTGDPAQFAKINTDNIDISFKNSNKFIEQTHFNMFKRIAKDIAPGREADWGSDSEYNVLMIDEPKINSKLGNVFSKYKKAYSNIKLADAQEWTTLKEHLTVKLKYGEITKEQYDELLEAGNNKNLSFNQILLVLNPMKPVQVMNEFDNELGQYVSTYIKTSSFPLIPQLTEKFKELDNVREFMELNNINRIVPKSAVKTGFRKSFDLKNINNSKFTNNLVLKNQDKFLTKLNRSGFRIQQDVPYSFSKEHYKEGSQLRKLIFANLLNEDGTEMFFNVNNSEYSGFELKKLNDEIHQEFYERKFDKLLLKLGAVKTDSGIFLSNVDEIRNLLVQEAENRGYSINDILALKTINLNNKTIFETSLFFHPMVHKVEQLLTSIIKNKVLVNKYPGKSFVQGSSLNFNVATEDLLKLYDNKNSVIFSKDYNPEDGLQYKVKEDGSIVAQVFITMPFKNNNGEPLPIENYLDANNKIDFSKLPKNMLEMIGYRIPTQGPNSIIKLEVVGILPEVMGDLVIVPPEITVQMGSDFDVDKLNIHWYNYNINKDGVVSKINSNEEEYLLYKKFVKSKILEKEDIDEELLDSIDDEVKALVEDNYSKFKKSWNNYRKKLSKTLGDDRIVKEFVLDDEYKNVWLPKFKEVSKQIVETYTISQVSELASDYNIISFDEFKKIPMVKKLSMKQLENLSIDAYMSVLSNSSMAERIIAPLENNYFDDAIEYINSLRSNNKSKESDTKLSNSVLNEKLHSDMVSVQSAGKIGVAIESMASTFHALSQFAGLYLTNNSVLFSKKENGDDIYTDTDIDDNMSPTGNTMNKNVKYIMAQNNGAFRLDKVFSFSGRLISDIISNIQTEAVDNANNRKLYPMNLNPITFDVANLIARVGFDEKIIGLFLNQPIILDYLKKIESLNSFFDTDANFENVKTLQVEMLNSLGLNISVNDLDKLRSSNISIEEMENSISNNDLSSKTQLIALQNFIIYSNIANELRDIQSAANIDTKFLGGSISELEEKNNFFKNQNIKEIGNWENLFYNSEGTKTTQGAAYEYGVVNSIDLFKNILPIDSIFLNKIKSNIKKLTKRKIKSKDIEKIQIDLRSAIYWHVIKDLFNIDTNTYRENLISGENNLGKRLIDFKNSNKNNSFTNSLSVFRPNSKSEHIEVHHFSSKNDKEDVSLKKQLEWLKMLNSDKNSEEFKLGFDLLIYATTFGTEKNANDFSRFIPIDYLRNSGILSGINKFSFNETNENAITLDAYKSFYSQFLRHNPRYASKFDAKDVFFEKGEKIIDTSNEVIIDDNSELYDDNGRLPFAIKTYVNKELCLYFRSKGNKYSRVGLLGSTPSLETNLLTEYDLANKYNKSIFNDNFNKEFNEYDSINNTTEKSPEDVILNDYNFNNGIESVLKRISVIGTSNEYKELAKLYLEKINLIKEFKLEEYNPSNPIHYNEQKNESLNKKGATIIRDNREHLIVIDKHNINTNYFQTKREDFEHTFLHEVGHAITRQILLNYGYVTKEQKLIIDEIDKIISEFKDDAPVDLKYFFKNNREFVTAVMSNKKMQNYLNGKIYKSENLLSKIFDLIKKIIGYNPSKNTALSAAMDNVLRLIDSISESQINEIMIEYGLPTTVPTYIMDYATKVKNKCL